MVGLKKVVKKFSLIFSKQILAMPCIKLGVVELEKPRVMQHLLIMLKYTK